MPQKYRLSRADFTRMRGFKRLHGKIFSLSYGTIPDRTRPGGACIVSSKVAPTAVARNRIKRRCRSVLLELVKNVRSPMIIVYYAKKGAQSASFLETEHDLKDLFTRSTS